MPRRYDESVQARDHTVHALCDTDVFIVRACVLLRVSLINFPSRVHVSVLDVGLYNTIIQYFQDFLKKNNKLFSAFYIVLGKRKSRPNIGEGRTGPFITFFSFQKIKQSHFFPF